MKNLFYTRPVLHGKRCNMILSSRTATSVITSIERKRDIDIDIDVDRKKKEKERERETVLSESEIGSSVTWTLGVRRELAAGLDRTHDSYFYKQYIYNIYIHIFIYRYPFFFLNSYVLFLFPFFFFFLKLFFWQLYGSFIAAGFLFLRVSSVISRKIKVRGNYFRCCRWLLFLFQQEK